MNNPDIKKLLIISEELTKSIGKNQFLSLFTKEHDIIIIDHCFENDINNTKSSSLPLRSRAKKMYVKLKPYLEAGYSHKVFIGCGDDGKYLFELFFDKGITFDGAVLINCDLSQYPHWKDTVGIKQLLEKTKIWNFYSKSHLHCHRQKLENFLIPTRRSPQFNSRYSLESYGVIIYGVYARLSLLNEVGSIKMLSNAG